MSIARASWRSAALTFAVIAWCATTSCMFAFRLASPDTLSSVSGVSLAVAALSAGVGGLCRARVTAPGRTRSAWLYLGLAALSWGCGQLVTVTYEVVLHEDVPFPSLADVGYLTTVVLFGAGLLRLAVPAPQLATRLRAVLDGLLISTALLLVSWSLVLGPVAHESTDDLLSKIVLLAYPAGDVAIVTLVAYVALRIRVTGVRPGVPLSLIGIALASFAFADSGYAYLSLVEQYESGSFIDAGWLFGFCALLVAAVRPGRPAAEQAGPETRPLGMLLPYLVILVAVTLSAVVTNVKDDADSTGVWLRSLLVLLMVIRQVIALQENSRLTATLERRVAERTAELGRSQERFRALVEHSSDVVSLIGDDGTVVYQSESSQRVLGRTSDDLLGTRFADLLDPHSQATLAAAVAEVSRAPLGMTTVELRLMHGDGAWRQVETTLTNLLDDPAVHGLVLNTQDVSERRQLERQLTHQAFHDSLTGLANRALFGDRVSHALARRRDCEVAVLFVDLNGFKEVNDSLGHDSGDKLLTQVAERLLTCVRAGDTIARLGGDEFAILVETGAEQAEQLADRIRAALQPVFDVDDRELFMQGSIGIAVAEPGTTDAGQLIRNADLAMYQAKAHRDAPFVVYDPGMHSSLVEKLELESDLRKAIRGRELEVHYQPTYNLATGELVGVEALLRWTHPQRGPIGPVVFIPLAEQSGLIHELGSFVLDEACRQGTLWQENAPSGQFSISVNVSGRQLQRADFCQEVQDVLARTGLPPHCLTLEVTESILMEDAETSVATLFALKALGVRIAIDDFGTGYSSLSYLQRFPVDILKIDRSFVQHLSVNGAKDNLVESIVQLGQTLHLQTIAEGIEDHAQLLTLRRLGCQLAQGYHFGRPGPPESIAPLLEEGDRSGETGRRPSMPRQRDGATSPAEAV